MRNSFSTSLICLLSGWGLRPSAAQAKVPILVFAVLAAATATHGEQPRAVDFASQVQPLLAKRCIECHGPDAQESDLRLDARDWVLRGGESGEPALVAFDAENSQLMHRVTASDDKTRMPPEDPSLTKDEVALLRDWIDQGAPWPDALAGQALPTKVTTTHWSFQPIATPQPPVSEDPCVTNGNAIDAFVLAGLVAKGLEPSPQADRRTLVRRLYLDMHGLPPTPEEVQSFVGDASPQAWQNLVTRVLESPHYGERWAQHWLDVIRYADTRGYEFNTLRENTWPFRDWVIEAFNNDLHYDQFLFQQIAGDTIQVDPATGFLVTAPLPTPPEVGQEPAAIRMARFNSLDEVIQNVGSAMLGLTVGCARCHNHKFDPISQRDYYRMVAVFSGLQYDVRPWRKAKDAESAAELKQIEQRSAAIRAELMNLPHWRVEQDGQYTDYFQPLKAKWMRLTVTSTDATSEGPAFDEVEVWTALQNGTPPQRVSGKTEGGKATSSGAATQLGSTDEFLNDGRTGKSSTWVADRRPSAWVQIEFSQPRLINRVTWSRDRDLAGSDIPAHAHRLASEWQIEVAEEAGQWKAVIGEARGDGVTAEAVQHRRDLETELRPLVAREAELRMDPTVFAGKFTDPEPIHVLVRGNPEQPRQPVGPGGLEILSGSELSPTTSETERRIAFAKWIAGKDNPLTARVAVNRIWHHHFGKGLVDTPSDFGTVGSKPTHPELLDWLASELIASGWSMKHLHKLILTSNTYRQSSQPEEKSLLADADSRYVWRFPPRRLDAETIRDSMLSVTGVLDLKMGGAGVNIYGPKGNFDQWKPKPDPGPESWRRMIYLARMRGADDGMFKQFDLPDCGQVRASRGESTTPLQALNLLNGRFTIEQSTLLAERLQREAGNDMGAQITRAYELLLSRPPSPRESSACLATAQTEGLATVCRALFNTNEFLFIP